MANKELEQLMEELEQLMGKLKHLLSDENNSLIGSNQMIQLAILPEIEVHYEELTKLIGSSIMSMSEEQLRLHEPDGYVGNLKKRVVDASNEAVDIVDMRMISSANLEKVNGKFGIVYRNLQGYHLELRNVINDIRSLRMELEAQTVSLANNNNIHHLHLDKKGMKLESQPSPTRNTVTENEEVIVGLEEQARLIMDRLAGDHKQLDIISIVGMGGLGKTTLATKIFNDRYVEYYFHVRGWVTVSQAYTKQDLLKGILESIGKSVHEAATQPMLREMLHKSLLGRRYMIVIDDIWSADAWNDLRLYFPDDKTCDRILLTTRLTEVASHASRGGFIHNLLYLTNEESWELLCRKTFRVYECPESLIETGKEIAIKCQGLPLALVVIAGVLEKAEKNKNEWENVAESVSSYVVNDPNGCLDALALSYDHLHQRLRNCFLYVGGFPEDYNIQVKRLIRLWMAEGFILEVGGRSLEEEAEDCLMDLVGISMLRLETGLWLLRSFPNIKELGCFVSADFGNCETPNFAFLTHLEALKVENCKHSPLHLVHPIWFPESLKRLTLKGLHLPWSYMSTIQQLPNLEVLKLLDYSFKGRLWNTGDGQFRQLKFLKLHNLEIESWETSCINFPRLKKLVIGTCKNLKETPQEIGGISTLEYIEIDHTNFCLRESVNRIQEDQHELGNDDIHVKFLYFQPAEVFYDGHPFYD